MLNMMVLISNAIDILAKLMYLLPKYKEHLLLCKK